MYAFDFCKTMVLSNSTFDFIRFCSERSIEIKIRMFVFFGVSKFLFDAKIISSNDLTKIRLLTLRGITENKIGEMADSFSSELVEKENVKVMKEFNSLVESGKKVLIVTNTLDVVINAYLKKIGLDNSVELICSTIECHNKKFTGKYRTYVLEEGKLALYMNIYGTESIKKYWTDDLVADADIASFSELVELVESYE